MNFKEILERYRAGEATDEERQYIEQELEKYESIEEYFSEEIPDQLFDEESSDDLFESSADEAADIQKVVNRRLRKVVLTSVLIVVLLYILIFYGVSNLVDQFHYDPTATTEQQEGEAPIPDFYFDLQAYISLNLPGYSIASVPASASTGFGNYENSYAMNDLFEEEREIYFVNLSRGRLAWAYDGIFDTEIRVYNIPGFEKIQNPFPDSAEDDALDLREEIIQQNNELTLQYLEGVNEFSYVSMNISFEEDLTMEEFHQMRNTYPNLDFKWMGVRTAEPMTRWNEEQPMFLIGFNPNFNAEPDTMNRPDPEKYPYFDLTDVMEETSMSIEEFPKTYATHFTSRLSYLSEQEEFIEIFDANPQKIDFYKDSLDYVNENGVETYGGLVYGTAEEFLEALDEIPYDTLHINDVSPTAPNIYNR